MSTVEHLLQCLGEEGAEIALAASKANRFGILDVNPLKPDGPDNEDRIVSELNDLLGVARMLVKFGVIPQDWQSEAAQIAKEAKLEKFMDYAETTGALNPKLP